MSNQPNMPQGGSNNSYGNNQSNHGSNQPGNGYGNNQTSYGGNQPGNGYGNNQTSQSGYGGNHPNSGNNQPSSGSNSFANTPQGGGNYSNAPSGGYNKPMSKYQEDEDTKKNWKIGGGIAAGVLAAGAAAFGAKYYMDHQQGDNQEHAQIQENKPANYGSSNAPLNPGESKPVSQNYQQHNQEQKSENQYQQQQQQNQHHHQQQQNQCHQQEHKSSSDSHRPSGAQGVTPHAYPLIEHHSGEEQIKIGSKIALKHNMTGRFLAHSQNAPTNDNGGSGQHLLYCSGWNVGSEEHWQVIPANGEVLVPGHPLEYGTYIRLRHVDTKRQAHSHNGLKALRSGQQEATGFGGETSSDNNDHWVVDRYGGGHGAWTASDIVTFRHAETGRYLHSHPEMLDDNRQEVTCGGDGRDENDKWRVCFH